VDLLYAFRALSRTPAFSLFAIATLALGIGASTTMFAVVDAVLLKPLPFRDPQTLATVQPDSGARISERFAYEWRSQSRTTTDLAGWFDARMVLSGRGEPVEVFVDRTTPNFFDVLGARPLLGRTFAHARDLRRVEREVVLGYGLWQRRFSGEPRVVGQSITLDDTSFTIVGVMPPGFAIRTNELPESRAELWAPFQIDPDAGTGMGGALNVVARLARTASFQEAQVEFAAISDRLEAERPSFTRNWRVQVVPLQEATVQRVRTTLVVLFGSVGILLLLACVNLATLLLGRTTARTREIAIRISLGATSARVIQQLVTETSVLAAVGGCSGALVAFWGTHLVSTRLPSALDLPRVGQISADYRTLAFTLAITTCTAVVLALFAAFRSVRLVTGSSTNVRTTSTSNRGRYSADVLLVGQIALAVALLACAGLLIRSFETLTRVNLGFAREGVLTMRTTLSSERYDSADRIRAFTTELLTRAASIPGVHSVGSANYLPLTNVGEGSTFQIEGRTYARPDEQPGSWRSVVGGRYFETMGIPLIRGRLPGSRDTDRTQPVVVIDEVLARRYWPNSDPVGAGLRFNTADGANAASVVIGIVGSVRWMASAAEPPGTTYLWFPQQPRREITLVARLNGASGDTATALRRVFTESDPGQPVSDVRMLDDFVAADIARPRFTMWVLTGFAAVAIVLAAIGLYSVISFDVLQRTREVGVRLALGAQRRDVIRLFMSTGLLAAGVGVIAGLGCTLAVGRVVEALLYGVSPRDPMSIVAATLLVAVVAIVATYVPAFRATRVDPVVALRRE
jgi:predicted permease